MNRLVSLVLPLVLVWPAAVVAQSAAPNPKAILELAKGTANLQGLRDAITSTFKEEDLKAGKAVVGYQDQFLFVVASPTEPKIFIDEAPGPKMSKLNGSGLWTATAQLRTGTSHNVAYQVDGKMLGLPVDFAAFTADSYEKPGVPQGKVSEKIVHQSKIYEGMTNDYWIYTPAQYDGSKPVALMVWQDGEKYVRRDGSSKLQIVLENLMHEGRIPVAIHVFISPGMKGQQRMRAIEYDTVDDTYAKYLRDEILKDVSAKFKIRTDAYSRAIAGESSGAICAFNVAWWHTDQFSRVLSRIGSYTSIQWKPWEKEGGNIYPFLLRKSARKNIRVWVQDGANDLENNHGSWPLQNIAFANSLKMKEYDFKFSFGTGQHNTHHGNAELPESLTWLWRGYDAAKTEETYQMDPAEKDKPFFRVQKLNRQ